MTVRIGSLAIILQQNARKTALRSEAAAQRCFRGNVEFERLPVGKPAVKYHVANAIAKLGVRNRKALKSWAGSHNDNLLTSGKTEMNDNVKYSGVGQVSRSVSNIEAAEHWYRDALGLDHLYTFGDLAFFDCGGTRLMLSQAEEKPGNESLVYLRVPDIDAAHKRLTDNGVEFVNAPHMIHKHDDGAEEWMAFFNDPEGRPLANMSVVGSTESRVIEDRQVLALAAHRLSRMG